MNKSKGRFALIRQHFEKEAAGFDRLFFKVMPRYEEMMQALVDALPFDRKERVRILDLGCGTGNLSKRLIRAFPFSRITCVDMAENMLAMARLKLKTNRNVSFWQGDIREFGFKQKYDVIVASMVLHHIEGKDKPRLYRTMRDSLSKDGVFFCIDIFLSPDRHLQKLYMDKWKAFMRASGLDVKKTDEMIARHQREDRPVVFKDELDIMRKAGFRNVDVVLKHYNFAVYGGSR